MRRFEGLSKVAETLAAPAFRGGGGGPGKPKR